MKQALLVCNGINFNYDLADRAFAWVIENSGTLHALFLARHESEEGYGFPSDIDAAQEATDKNDADQCDMNIIDSHMQLLEDMAKAKNITCSTRVLIEPSLEDVLAQADKKDILFIDAGSHDSASLKNFNLHGFLARLPAQMQKVLGE